MADTKLILTLANRNYSSWSMRAWLALEQTGAAFEEDRIWFDEDRDRAQRHRRGPTGKVPVLRHGDLVIWDSLAIGEYLAETFPGAGLWPTDRVARARARSLCCEMHSGFLAVRETMPLNIRHRTPYRDRGEAVAADIARISEAWVGTRRDHGQGGPFLFGARSLADAFFAPVICRFRTYGIELDGPAAAYSAAVLELPAMRDWIERAESETHSDPPYDDFD